MKKINPVAPFTTPLCIAFIQGQYNNSLKISQHKKRIKARRGKPLSRLIRINKEAEEVCVRGKKRQLYPLPDREFIMFKDLIDCIPMSNLTMDKIINKGEFPAYFKKKGRSRLWKVKEVQDWLDKQDNLNLIKN